MLTFASNYTMVPKHSSSFGVKYAKTGGVKAPKSFGSTNQTDSDQIDFLPKVTTYHRTCSLLHAIRLHYQSEYDKIKMTISLYCADEEISFTQRFQYQLASILFIVRSLEKKFKKEGVPVDFTDQVFSALVFNHPITHCEIYKNFYETLNRSPTFYDYRSFLTKRAHHKRQLVKKHITHYKDVITKKNEIQRSADEAATAILSPKSPPEIEIVNEFPSHMNLTPASALITPCAKTVMSKLVLDRANDLVLDAAND